MAKMTKRDFFNTVLSMEISDEMREMALAELKVLDKEREKRAKQTSEKAKENKKLATELVERMEVGKQYLSAELVTDDVTVNKISVLLKLATEMGLTSAGVVKVKSGYRNCYTRLSVGEAVDGEAETEAEAE